MVTKKRLYINKIISCIGISLSVFATLFIQACGSPSYYPPGSLAEPEDTIEKLAAFTDHITVGDREDFCYSADDSPFEWDIMVFDEHSVIELKDSKVIEILDGYGIKLNTEYSDGFIYNVEEGTVLFNLDTNYTGNYSQLLYRTYSGKASLYRNDKHEWYGLASDFSEYLNSNGFFEQINKDVDELESQLNTKGITLGDVNKLRTDAVYQYYK